MFIIHYSLLIRCIIYCIIQGTHDKVMWINLSLACQDSYMLLAELAALPAAYLLLASGLLCGSCRLKPLKTRQKFFWILKVVSWMFVSIWRGRRSDVRPAASGDLSQPCSYSPVRDGLLFDPSALYYLHALYWSVSALLLLRGRFCRLIWPA